MKDERKQPDRGYLLPPSLWGYTQSTPKRRNRQAAKGLLPVLFHYPPPGTI